MKQEEFFWRVGFEHELTEGIVWLASFSTHARAMQFAIGLAELFLEFQLPVQVDCEPEPLPPDAGIPDEGTPITPIA